MARTFGCFLTVLSVVVMASADPAVADGKWEIIKDSELDAKVHLNYVRFFDENIGFAHGHQGLLLMTGNGGKWLALITCAQDKPVSPLDNLTYV